jgi:hypothetical protein
MHTYICIYMRDMYIMYVHITQPARVGGVESALMQQLQQRHGMPPLQLLHERARVLGGVESALMQQLQQRRGIGVACLCCSCCISARVLRGAEIALTRFSSVVGRRDAL